MTLFESGRSGEHATRHLNIHTARGGLCLEFHHRTELTVFLSSYKLTNVEKHIKPNIQHVG